MISIDSIVESISHSKKYATLAPQTITRIVTNTAERYPEKLVEAEAKKKLHQIWGAYYSTRPNFQKLRQKLSDEIAHGNSAQEMLLPLLKIHASTAERLPILNEFYAKIFAVTGHPTSILDHACGMNALALPWMQLPATTNYTAQDIDAEEVLFENFIFQEIIKNKNAKAEVKDLFEDSTEYYQIHFLFKILPLIEQQQKGAAHTLLKKLNGEYLIVTYPTSSLSGASKGMLQTYTKQCEEIIKEEKWDARRIEFSTELVYIIRKN